MSMSGTTITKMHPLGSNQKAVLKRLEHHGKWPARWIYGSERLTRATLDSLVNRGLVVNDLGVYRPAKVAAVIDGDKLDRIVNFVVPYIIKRGKADWPDLLYRVEVVFGLDLGPGKPATPYIKKYVRREIESKGVAA